MHYHFLCQPTTAFPNGVKPNANDRTNDKTNVSKTTIAIWNDCELICSIKGIFHIKWHIIYMCDKYIPNDKFENTVMKLFTLSDIRNTFCKRFIVIHQKTHCMATKTERYQNNE